MKYIIAVISLIVVVSGYSQNADVAMVKEIMNRQETCWNQGDLVCFMEGYWNSDSLTFIGSKGLTYGWAKTLENYQVSYPNKAMMGKLTFGLNKVIQLDEQFIYVIGSWHLKRSADDLGGHFTLLWKKINGQWKIIADHSS